MSSISFYVFRFSLLSFPSFFNFNLTYTSHGLMYWFCVETDRFGCRNKLTTSVTCDKLDQLLINLEAQNNNHLVYTDTDRAWNPTQGLGPSAHIQIDKCQSVCGNELTPIGCTHARLMRAAAWFGDFPLNLFLHIHFLPISSFLCCVVKDLFLHTETLVGETLRFLLHYHHLVYLDLASFLLFGCIISFLFKVFYVTFCSVYLFVISFYQLAPVHTQIFPIQSFLSCITASPCSFPVPAL